MCVVHRISVVCACGSSNQGHFSTDPVRVVCITSVLDCGFLDRVAVQFRREVVDDLHDLHCNLRTTRKTSRAALRGTH